MTESILDMLEPSEPVADLDDLLGEEKPKRPRSLLQFIRSCDPSKGKTPSDEFLAKHQAYLESFSFLHGVLQAYREQVIAPTQARQCVHEALYAYFLECKSKATDAAVQRAKEKQEADLIRVVSPEVGFTDGYCVSVWTKEVDSLGIETESLGVEITYKIEEDEETGKQRKIEIHTPMLWHYATFQEAYRKGCRVLVARGDGTRGEVVNCFDSPIKTEINRTDAFSTIFPKKKGAICRVPSKTTKSLKAGQKTVQTRVVGPWSNHGR
jgi:hypothetical protein